MTKRILKLGVRSVTATSLVALTCAIQSAPALAQDLPGDQASASGTERSAPDDEIIVTAQKRNESQQKVPISITVLTGAVLDKQGTGGVMNALTEVPGVSVEKTASSPGGTQITIRGVAPAAGFVAGGNTVAYYVDSAPFGLVRTAISPDANGYDMSRVEVLRGPQGTLYGASALNGVVRLITNDPDPTAFDLKARASAYSIKEGNMGYRGDLAVNVPLVDDVLAVRFVLGGERSGGWIDQPSRGVKDANEGDNQTYRAKLGFTPDDRLSITLSAWVSRFDLGAHAYSDGGNNQQDLNEAPQSSDYEIYSGNINYDFDNFSVSSSTSYFDVRIKYLTDLYFLAPTAVLRTENGSKVFSEELNVNSRDTEGYRWSGGAFYRVGKDVLFQSLPLFLPADLKMSDKSVSYALFGEFTKAFLNDRLELTGGLRYFHDRVSQAELTPVTGNPNQPLGARKASFEAVTPRLVLTYLPSSDFTAYASYSQGYRSGFGQNILTLSQAPEIGPVSPDKLASYEIGAKGRLFDGVLAFDAAIYYIDWKDIQQQVQYFVPSINIYAAAVANVAGAEGVGVDLNLRVRPSQSLNFGGGISWNNLKLNEDLLSGGIVLRGKGMRISNSPELTLNGFVNYEQDITTKVKSIFSIAANYRSRVNAVQQSGLNSVFIFSDSPFSMRASAELRADHWSLTAFAENVSNWGGMISPPNRPGEEFHARPRTVGLLFEYRY